MKRYIKRIAIGIIGAILAAFILPVAAAGQAHPRILKLNMGEPGAVYDIYFAACLEDVLFDRVSISRKPAEEEMEVFLRPENMVLSVIADHMGEARIDFSAEALEDGVYLVTGKGCEPFYVCIPAPEGDGWAYTVEVYPGYLVGGEAEPMPSGERLVQCQVETQRSWAGELGGIILVTAAGCLFFLRIFRPAYR